MLRSTISGGSHRTPSLSGLTVQVSSNIRQRATASTFRSRFMPLATHHRVLLALKSALAAALAWFIALHIPGVAAEFPYYAPIGAMAAMYTTVGGSARQGIQTVIGLGLGISIAFVVTQIAPPDMWTVALVVGVGVLIAGLPRMGAGKDLIPTAALIVMLLGDQDPHGFSAGYFLQMLVGVIVGLVVNAAIFPPLHLNGAVNGLAELRSALSLQLADMSKALQDSWPPDHTEWSERGDSLLQLNRKVHDAVALAEVSQEGNFRRKINHRDISVDVAYLKSLERTTFHVRDVTEILAAAIWHEPEEHEMASTLADPLAEAFTACAEAVKQWDPDGDAHAGATGKVAELQATLNHAPRGEDSPLEATASLVLSLRRMLKAIRE